MTSSLYRIPVALAFLLGFGNVHAQLVDSDRIDSFLEQAVRTTKVPGIVAIVVDRTGIVYSGTFGYQNVAADMPMSLDTIFAIASMTKPVASTAIMMLVEEGRIDLDAPISKYLPQFRDTPVISSIESDDTLSLREPARQITIRDLMSHSSGLAYGFSNAIVYRLNGNRPYADNADIGLLYDPGSSWSYGTGIGYVAKVVEMVSGRSFDVFLRDRLLRPLGMSDTAYAVLPDDYARVAAVHEPVDGELIEMPMKEKIASTVSGNGGLYSTALDYAKFIRLFLNDGVTTDGERLLSEKSIESMGENQLGDVRVLLQDEPDPKISRAFPIGVGRDGFGLGFQVTGPHDEDGMRAPGSLSWAGILNTHFWIDRRSGIGAVLLMQYLPFYDEDAIQTLKGFEQRVYEAISP